MSKVNVSLKIPVNFIKEGKYFTAFTPAFDLATQGDSLEDAKKMFIEAVQIFIDELNESGNLEEELLSLGWKKINGNLKPPRQIVEEVTVPVNIVNA